MYQCMYVWMNVNSYTYKYVVTSCYGVCIKPTKKEKKKINEEIRTNFANIRWDMIMNE